MTDFYDRTGEYVAVLLGSAWEGLGPALTQALDGLDTTEGPVVDVGAGTGLGTAVMAAALPAAEIVAVEPHRALRTALLARVAADPALRDRVTVLDTDLLGADLPDRISALVAMNVLGHFSRGDRDRIWALLAARLTNTGRAVLNLYPPFEPASVAPAPMGEIRVGRRTYRGVAGAEPAGPDAVTWQMHYTIEQDGRPAGRLTACDHWFVLTPQQLADEVAAHGLRVAAGDPAQGVQVITRGTRDSLAAG